MKNLSEYLSEQLRNPEFAREYEAFQTEMDEIRSGIDMRDPQNLNKKEPTHD